MDMINLTINGKEISAAPGTTILQAARDNDIYIPTLCNFPGLEARANCRICVVEVEGYRTFQPACATKISEGMVVNTDTDAVRNARKTTLELILADHAVDCHHCLRIGSSKCDDLDPVFCEMCFWCNCPRDGFCELQNLAREYKVDMLPYVIRDKRYKIDNSLGSVTRNANKCIKCRRCIDVCGEVQTVHNLSVMSRSTDIIVVPELGKPMVNSACVHCGRCANVCPTGAIYMEECKDELLFYTHSYDFTTVAQVDEKVIAELEKNYKIPAGSTSTNQLVSALRKIGFDYVVTDSYFKGVADKAAADIIAKADGKTVLITESPAAVRFVKKFYPELCEQLNVVDTTQKLFGDYVKGAFAEEKGLDPAKIKTVNITTSNELCAEAADTGCVDLSINARELYRIFLRTGGAPHKKNDSDPDVFGETAEPMVNDDYDFMSCGEAAVTELDIAGKKVSAAVANNLGQTRELLEKFKAGKAIAQVLWLRA